MRPPHSGHARPRAPPRRNRNRVTSASRAQALYKRASYSKMSSARLLVAMAIVACTASAIKHKLERQQEKAAAAARRRGEEVLIDRSAIDQIGKSKLVYHLILAGCSGAPGPHC